jgi:hypothetical protein
MQAPLRIYIETKRDGELDADQVRRHLEGIAADGSKGGDFLIGITKEQIAEVDRNALATVARDKGIIFAAVTFSQIAEALKQQCAPYESDLSAIVDDYESYLDEEGLLEERGRRLLVFPCGTSIEDNARFGLYNEPRSRPCRASSFIGVYTLRTVRYVGKVEAIAVASFENGIVNFLQEAGQLTDQHKERIKAAVDAMTYYPLREPHRHYVVDHFAPTDLRKDTPGGIRGAVYLDLPKILSSYDRRTTFTTEELAAALNGRSWS